jgi:poly(beta-D-mannuronate) lyase
MSMQRIALVAGLLLPLLLDSGAAIAGLVPPSGYLAPPGHRDKPGDCPAPPAAFMAKLDFPSKYEGSDKARDDLNEKSNAEYKRRSAPISEMEKGAAKRVDKYMQSGHPADLKCAIDWYMAWAGAGALRGEAVTHTGKSMRKWALASLSGAWLRLKFSSAQPLSAYPRESAQVEAWLGSLADTVVREWSLGEAKNVNNHYYWSAWALMATAVILDRRDLFDWSASVYRRFAAQVDRDGYLPNEMARETRALGYHVFALTPLAMIAAFGKANGLDLAAENDGALKRVAERTLAGIDDPRLFEQRSGHRQVREGFDEPKAKLAWLEAYCWTVGCAPALAGRIAAWRPMKNSRLGGDVSGSFGGPR